MEPKERCELTLQFLKRFSDVLQNQNEIDYCVIGRQSVTVKQQGAVKGTVFEKAVGISGLSLPDNIDDSVSDITIDVRVSGEAEHFLSKIPSETPQTKKIWKVFAKDQIILDALTGMLGSEIIASKKEKLVVLMSSPDLTKFTDLNNSLNNLCYYALYPVMQSLSGLEKDESGYVTNFIDRLKAGIEAEIKNQQKLLRYFECGSKTLLKDLGVPASGALFGIVYFSLWQAGVGFEPFAAQADPASIFCMVLVLLAIITNAIILKHTYDTYQEVKTLLDQSKRIEQLVLSKSTFTSGSSSTTIPATPEKREEEDCEEGLERERIISESQMSVFRPD